MQPIVLAAGTGSRFGGGGAKLTAPLASLPLAAHLFGALGEARRQQLVASGLVVLRPEAADLAALASDYGLDVVTVASPSLSASLRVAIAARPEAPGWLMLLADQPFSTISHWRRLIAAWQGGAQAVFSDGGAGPQPPALFDQKLRLDLSTLVGDRGAGQLIHRLAPPPMIVRFPPGVWMRDVDTVDDLDRLQREITARRPARRRDRDGA